MLLCEEGLRSLQVTIMIGDSTPWQEHTQTCRQCRDAQPILVELIKVADHESAMETSRGL